MERSLAAAVSGITSNQTYLDAIGNNIANSSTDGYKQQNVIFSTLLAQQINGASAPTPPAPPSTLGGVNPVVVGSGVQVAAITRDLSEGTPTQTGLPSNAAIQGNGFFAVKQGNQPLYTRAGDFTVDGSGNLVTPTGAIVQGVNASGGTLPTMPTSVTGLQNVNITAAVPAGKTLVSYSIGANGIITGAYSDGTTGPLAQIALVTFTNRSGLAPVGNNTLQSSANSGTATVAAPGSGSAGNLVGGEVEGSNVNLAQQLTDLVSAQTDYEANTKVVGTTSQVLQALVNMP